MLIQKYISFYDFVNSFSDTYKNHFSYEGKKALYEYLDDLEYEIDLDPVSFCCDYTEYDSLQDVQAEYTDVESMEELQNTTTVIMIDDTRFIIENY